MLIGIPACLGPQILFNLRAMGHGDELAIVDGNYPALAHAGGAGGVVRADGIDLITMLDAVLAMMPIDDFVDESIFMSTVNGDGKTRAPVHTEIDAAVERRYSGLKVVPMTGDIFYPRVKSAHTIIATSEPRLYANVIIRKGVIRP